MLKLREKDRWSRKEDEIVTKNLFSPSRTDQMFLVFKLVTQIHYTPAK
jgi:hypothetical protein